MATEKTRERRRANRLKKRQAQEQDEELKNNEDEDLSEDDLSLKNSTEPQIIEKDYYEGPTAVMAPGPTSFEQADAEEVLRVLVPIGADHLLGDAEACCGDGDEVVRRRGHESRPPSRTARLTLPKRCPLPEAWRAPDGSSGSSRLESRATTFPSASLAWIAARRSGSRSDTSRSVSLPPSSTPLPLNVRMRPTSQR